MTKSLLEKLATKVATNVVGEFSRRVSKKIADKAEDKFRKHNDARKARRQDNKSIEEEELKNINDDEVID